MISWCISLASFFWNFMKSMHLRLLHLVQCNFFLKFLCTVVKIWFNGCSWHGIWTSEAQEAWSSFPHWKQIIGYTEQQPRNGTAGKAGENLDVNLLHIVTKCTKQLFHSMTATIKIWTLWQNLLIWTSMYMGTWQMATACINYH
jgi:hypothetical protein